MMCDVAHDAISGIGVYCEWGYSPMSLCQDAHHRMVNLENGLACSGPANVGTHCRQPDTNSCQIWPLPSGNGMFREPVPLEDRVEIYTRKPDAQFSRAAWSAHQEASFMKRILTIALML